MWCGVEYHEADVISRMPYHGVMHIIIEFLCVTPLDHLDHRMALEGSTYLTIRNVINQWGHMLG